MAAGRFVGTGARRRVPQRQLARPSRVSALHISSLSTAVQAASIERLILDVMGGFGSGSARRRLVVRRAINRL